MTEQDSGAACHHCRTAFDVRGTVGRRDLCPSCGADMRCCRNCDQYDVGYHNQCRETQAERQVDKERGNFCDFFRLARPQARVVPAAASARRDLDSLFGKSPAAKKGAGDI